MATSSKSIKTLQQQLKLFFEHLSQTANVGASARVAGLNRPTLYAWRKNGSPEHEFNIDKDEFNAAWDEAVELGNEFLEDTAIRRAAEGVTRDVYYQGEVVGEESVYSDALLMFMLKARRPERFKDRSAADINAKVTGTVVVQTAGPSDEAL